ncbi:MAG: hypothetical protein JWM02_709 [Frankiales bacterium]|nr:hypothetical protein [Frankiales bacterium]
MLCTNSYPKDYVEEGRARADAQVAAYQQLAAVARKNTARGEAALNAAIESFDAVFYNNMVLTLETYFTHRSRTIEGKDGNPLNEVRLLCNSMTRNDSIFTLSASHATWNATLKSDKTIKYRPEESVLAYKPGDEIKLSESDFVRLAAAYFATIEGKFM